MSHTQFGFRRNRSCLDKLAKFTSEILKAFEERNTVATLLLDIKSAYDNIRISILVDRLKEMGLLDNLLAFIINLTSEREIFVRYGELQCPGWTYRGLPQGSVLSPVLYALCTSKLKEVINSECRILEFVDDVAIYAVNRHHRMRVAYVEENAEAII
jgi:retron-type reverse transcriptase